MQFDVNGQEYVLNFNPQDERWYLLTPGFAGQVKAVPVFHDEEGFVPNIVAPVRSEGYTIH